MSQENVEIVLAGFDAFAQRDYEGVLRVFDENVEITQPPELLDAASLEQHGHAGVLEALAIWPEQWDDYRVGRVRVLADPGDHVVVAISQSGRGKQGGVAVEMDFTLTFTLRQKKITRWQLFVDEAQALEAAGLSE
jgi:ketosteroid isomerase-like protein